MKPKIVILSGLTASGKTALSIQLAQQFNAEIISADSRQVYQGLDIGTAKITPAEKQGIPHHLLDVVDPQKNTRYSVGDFQRDAYTVIDQIHARGKLPLLVGGTGLYTRAVAAGYGFAGQPNVPRYAVLQICLIPPNTILAPKVQQRNTDRVAQGMFAETRALLAHGVAPDFLDNLGLEYRLNLRYLQGAIDLETYYHELYHQTMQFIKRQRTWYRKEDPAYTHYLTDPSTYLSDATALITAFLSQKSLRKKPQPQDQG
ncbi:MAG: tRNA (adenosine(37)-N6)-dimethylallyltransferase MiaA [Prevotella sp.]|nr:tRNA (adenosine(37)-N6)-dimethylallyltransferase MiaA [Prevotella sp.]